MLHNLAFTTVIAFLVGLVPKLRFLLNESAIKLIAGSKFRNTVYYDKRLVDVMDLCM